MKLNAARRNALPDNDFAGSDRSFPIEDAEHARNALSRVADKPSAVKTKVKAKVARKYPNIGKKTGAPKYPGIAKDYLK